MNRRQARRLGRLTGEGINAISDRVEKMAEKDQEEAARGESRLTRAQLDSAAMLRRQAEKAEAEAAEAEAAGKASKAARHRKVAARAHRQADEWEAKAAREAERLKARAADQDS